MSATQQPQHRSRTGGVWYAFLAAALRREWLLLATVVGTIAADQVSKSIIKGALAVGESWPRDGIVRLTHGTNTGGAFGLFPDQTMVFTVASVVAIAFIIYYYRTQVVRRNLTRFTIGLLLGGALGNLIDRLRMGEVVDYIDVGWWPAFNLADSSIFIGMTLLVAILLLTGGAEPRAGQHSDAGGGGPDSP